MRWPNTVAIGDFLADVDSDADFRVTAKLTGWDDAAPIRVGVESRAQQDGGYDGPGFFDPRPIGVEGVVDLPSAAEAQAVKDALTSLRPREAYEFIVDNAAFGPRSAMVRVTQGAVVDWLTEECFTYTLQLLAPDPLKYGPAWFDSTNLASAAVGTGRTWPRVWPRDWGVPAGVTPGAVQVPNAGTAPYWPVLRLDGPVENAVIRCAETGDSLKVNTSITSGFFDLDCGERHFTFGANADDIRNFVEVTGSALAIPPGGATLTLEADSGTADTTLTVNGFESAWD